MISSRLALPWSLAILLAAAPELASAQVRDASFPCADAPVLSMTRIGNTLYLGGYFTAFGPPSGGGVVLDATTAARSPSALVTGEVKVAVSDGSGGWYLGGHFRAVGGVTRWNLAHVLSNGSVDAGFAPNPGLANGVVTSLVLSGNRLYVGGWFGSIGGEPRGGLAAIDVTDGTVLPWDPEPDGIILALALDGTTLYVGGNFTHVGLVSRQSFAAVDANSGALLPLVADASSGSRVNTLERAGTTLYVGGTFLTFGGQPRVRLAALDLVSGTVTGWNPSADKEVLAIASLGGTVYAGGTFVNVNATPRAHLAAIDAATGALTAWNPGADDDVLALRATAGAIYAGGNFKKIGATERLSAAAIDPVSGNLLAWDPKARFGVSALTLAGGQVYVGGTFGMLGGTLRKGLAAIDLTTATLTPWDPGQYGLVLGAGANTIYAGGFFPGLPQDQLVSIDATSGAIPAWDPQPDGQVTSIVADGSNIYISGLFGNVGEDQRPYVAAIDAATGVATAFRATPNDWALALARQGDALYVGGKFTNVSRQARNRLAELDAATGAVRAWNPNADGLVEALLATPTTVYAGGQFQTLGGQPRNGIAAIDRATGVVTAWAPDSIFEAAAFAREPGTIYAGGNGWLRAFDEATGTTQPWRLEPDWAVTSLDIVGTRLFVSGSFTSMGNEPAPHFAVYSTVSAIGVNPDVPRASLALAAKPNPAAGSSALSFTLPRAGTVSIDVIDASGRRVTNVLERAPRSAGPQFVRIDTASWRTGIYFVRMSFEESSAVTKFVVVH